MNINIITKETVTSTNTVLKQMANEGAPEGTVLIANSQTAGRGRLTRSFHSPANSGIYMSILVRPSIPASDALLLTIAAAVSTVKAIEDTTGLKASIKWVNDIYVNSKKTCGILTEGQLDPVSGGLAFAIVGIGVNLRDPDGGFPAEIAHRAGSLFGTNPCSSETKEAIINKLLAYFDLYYEKLTDKQYYDDYKSRSFLPGREVLVFKNIVENPDKDGISIPAKVIDVNPDFSLLVEYADGSRESLSSGEVSIKEL